MTAGTPPGGQLPVPDEVQGVQANFCRSPQCDNYGKPPSRPIQKGRNANNPYARYGRDKHKPALRCNHCGGFAPIKSNRGIVEELTRMQAYLQPPVQPSCRTRGCSSFGLSVSADPQLYRKHGETAAGTMRFQCKVCRKNVSAALQTRPKARAKSFGRDLDIFRSLINKLPIRRICRRDGVDAATVYETIDYIHRKALAFAAEHERRLPEMLFERLYLATDRQVYVVNWSSRKDRTNAQLTGIATADNFTGYVFGAHIDFDPSLDPKALEDEANAIGDLAKHIPDRRHARLWFRQDYQASRKQERRSLSVKGLAEIVAEMYADAQQRDDIEAPPPEPERKLPDYGMRVRSEYVMFAHFEFLRRQLRGCRRFRFYLDTDSGFRAAVLSAFHREVADARAEVFFAASAKDATRPQREKAVAQAWAEFEQRLAEIVAWREGGEIIDELEDASIVRNWEVGLKPVSFKELLTVFDRRQKLAKERRRRTLKGTAQDDEKDQLDRLVEAYVRRLMIRARFPHMQVIGPYGDRWLEHPMPRLNEPKKMVCRLTARPPDKETLSEDALAHLYDRASLHAVDNFFQIARRSFSLLDRTDRMATTGRIHHIYMAFDPAMIIKMLDIHRITHNFVVPGRDKMTPAMRLGLLEKPATLKDILLHPDIAPPMVRAKPIVPRPKKTNAPSSEPAAAPDLNEEIPF